MDGVQTLGLFECTYFMEGLLCRNRCFVWKNISKTYSIFIQALDFIDTNWRHLFQTFSWASYHVLHKLFLTLLWKEWVLKIYRVSLIKLRGFVDQKFNKLFYIMDTNALALKFQYNTERNDSKSLRFNRREEAWLYFGKKTCEWPGTLLGDPANPLRRHLQSPFSRLQLYNGWLQ